MSSPAVVDLTDEPEISTPETPDLWSLPRLENQIRLGKERGIYISLNEDHKQSRARRKCILRFLKELEELRQAETSATAASEINPDASDGKTAVDAKPTDPTPSAVKPENQPEEESDVEYDDESDVETPDPRKEEVSRLKRKGFPFNPICSRCERQFDEDDNGEDRCRYHDGSLEPLMDHDHFADADPEIHSLAYEGDEPDAYEWSCCEGNAEAGPCRTGAHREDYDSKKARLEDPWS